MPIITVWGLPQELEESSIEDLRHMLLESVVAVKELNLSKKQVTFFFPPDRLQLDRRTEIIVAVGGLFSQPERTAEVRNRLAGNLGITLKERFPDALVEVMVYSFDPASGFWTSEQGGSHA